MLFLGLLKAVYKQFTFTSQSVLMWRWVKGSLVVVVGGKAITFRGMYAAGDKIGHACDGHFLQETISFYHHGSL